MNQKITQIAQEKNCNELSLSIVYQLLVSCAKNTDSKNIFYDVILDEIANKFGILSFDILEKFNLETKDNFVKAVLSLDEYNLIQLTQQDKTNLLEKSVDFRNYFFEEKSCKTGIKISYQL